MSRILRVFAAILLVISAVAPLRTVLAYPHRLTVLPNLQVDAAAYDAIASDLVRTHSIDAIPPLQPPGFVTSLAAVYSVTGRSWTAARVWLWGVFLCCVLMSATLAWRVDRREPVPWLAALLTASAPALHGYIGTIQYEVVAAFWLLAILLAADWARARGHGAWAVVGLICAAAALTREVLVMVVPVMALSAAWTCRTRHARAATLALVVAACGAAPVAAWTAYQSTRTGRLVALSDKGPAVLAFGNNPRANGTFNAPAVGVSPPSGLDFIREHPTDFAALGVRKFFYFWGVLRDGWNVPRPSALDAARAFGGAIPLQTILPVARGGWILAVFLTALLLWRRGTWRDWWWVPASVAALMSVHLITLSSHRFAVPVLPAVFAIAAAPIASVAAWAIGTRTRGAAIAAVFAVATLMQLGAWPIRYQLRAVDMDAISVENVERLDEQPIRRASSSPGARPVLLLADEALPRGIFTIAIRMRSAASADRPVARAWLQTLDGAVICESALASSDIWRTAIFPCTLASDTIATLVVQSTAVTDLEFLGVTLQW